MSGHVLQNITSVKKEINVKQAASSIDCGCVARLSKLENILSEMKDIVGHYKIKSSLSFEEQNDFDNEDFHHGYRSALWCTVRRLEPLLEKIQ
jgi:hypothetical protein